MEKIVKFLKDYFSPSLYLKGIIVLIFLALMGHFFGYGGKLTGKEKCVLKEIELYQKIGRLPSKLDINKFSDDKESTERFIALLKAFAKQEDYSEDIIVIRAILEKCGIKY